MNGQPRANFETSVYARLKISTKEFSDGGYRELLF